MDQYIGEIRMFGGDFAPEGWAPCNGQKLSIAEYEQLFNLIGTKFGGDGVSNFALPDLRGRVPIHMGRGPGLSSYSLGQSGGTETVILGAGQLPAHTHQAMAQAATGDVNDPRGAVWAKSDLGSAKLYSEVAAEVGMGSRTTPTGGGYLHDNVMPYQAVNFIIALDGIYPSTEGRLAADPLMAEIRIFPYDITPQGWAACDGRVLPMNQNQALFSLIGKTYGGDGVKNFALPDLRGRVPMHAGQTPLGTSAGEEAHVLTSSEMPAHKHVPLAASSTADLRTPGANWWGSGSSQKGYSKDKPNTPMDASAIGSAGENQPHNNMQPYLTLNLCIAQGGEFPTRPARKG